MVRGLVGYSTNALLKKKVVILNADQQLRDRLELLIEGCDRFQVVGSFSGFDEALRMFQRTIPDVAVVDMDLSEANGVEAVRILKQKYPSVLSMMYTDYEDDMAVFESFKAGASGYIIRTTDYRDIIDALYELVSGGAPMTRHIARRLIDSYHINSNSPLTRREQQVLHMICLGKTYFEISEELHISPQTSKSHIRNIYTKLNVNSKSEAIAMANRERWI